jgi:hypothetical protein
MGYSFGIVAKSVKHVRTYSSDIGQLYHKIKQLKMQKERNDENNKTAIVVNNDIMERIRKFVKINIAEVTRDSKLNS